MCITSSDQYQDNTPILPELLGSRQSVTSLLVHLRHDVSRCVASFSGSITDATRITIDGVANLIAGEQFVILDFSLVDEVDSSGAEAVAVLVRSVQARGAQLRIAHPRSVWQL